MYNVVFPKKHIPFLELTKEVLDAYTLQGKIFDEDGSFCALDEGNVLVLFKGDYDFACQVKDFIIGKKRLINQIDYLDE